MTSPRLQQCKPVYLLAVVCLCAAMGCDDANRHAVAVRPSQIQPSVAAVDKQSSAAPLPFRQDAAGLPSLQTPPPSAEDVLVAFAQAQFEAGQQDYRAGHLTKARHDFDDAVDAMLQSGLDLEKDPRVAPLFQHIVETVSSEEFAAFREGDGFAEQKAEAAPLDEIPEMTFAEDEKTDPKLTASAEGELSAVTHDLPLTVNEYVLAYVNFFQTPRGRAIVETGLRRAGRYRPMIQKVLAQEGMPQDLIYLAQAESAFQPVAISHKQAVGLWQFVAGRAHQYGLERTWWVDERQDPEKATRAAARHLRDLYGMFNDWYLAMAAYDSGPGNVQKAIERTGYADFWELYRRNVLPQETRNYVPIILALALIGKDPQRYGIQVTPDPYIETDLVKPGHPIDLRLVAETIDVDVETLRALNPQLLRTITPADANYELRLPSGAADRFLSDIADIPPEKWVSWRRHRVEEGETLSEIARKYRVAPAAIADANGIESRAPLDAGEKLIIPAAARSEIDLGKLTRYRVRRGDTLATIADQFSVSRAELVKWNHLKNEKVVRGMTLRVYPGGLQPLPVAAKSDSKPAPTKPVVVATGTSAADKDAPLTHRVLAGETLWSIARAYRTTAEALRGANHFLFTRPLQVGDQLTILPAH
jgi:membrane-bound lytic murein transglycosylase D